MWYYCIALPLQEGTYSCFAASAPFFCQANGPEHADKLYRQATGYGPEVRVFVTQGTVAP